MLLPGAPKKPDLPLFLGERTWVDLRNGITPDGLASIVWGTTGKKPRRKERGPEPGPPPLHNLPSPPLGDLLKGRDEELRKLSESLEAGGLRREGGSRAGARGRCLRPFGTWGVLGGLSWG
ncbi:MAG: hypothetical protein ACJ76J_09820 [Thermoanaerobaculia bacterium]